MRLKAYNHILKFLYICLRESPGKNYSQFYGKSEANLWRNLSTGTPPKLFRTILCFVVLVYNYIFFRTEVLRKLFDIRFPFKHCNFSHVCLLVKMASKTVTRSILSGMCCSVFQILLQNLFQINKANVKEYSPWNVRCQVINTVNY